MTDKPDTTREAVERVGAIRNMVGDYQQGAKLIADDAEVDLLWCCNQIETLAAEVAALRLAVERARGEALEEAAGIADQHRRDTSLLLSNPPQSSAAWSIARAIRARI